MSQQQQQASAGGTSRASSSASRSSALRVLAIDDSVTILKQLAKMLGGKHGEGGFEVTLADSGARALELLQEATDARAATLASLGGGAAATAAAAAAPLFDVVICDVVMPGLSGVAVLQALRAGPPAWSGMPFIVMSSLDDAESLVEWMALGADDVLTKPFSRDLVLTRINAVLERVRLRSFVQSSLSTLSSGGDATAAAPPAAAAPELEPKSLAASGMDAPALPSTRVGSGGGGAPSTTRVAVAVANAASGTDDSDVAASAAPAGVPAGSAERGAATSATTESAPQQQQAKHPLPLSPCRSWWGWRPSSRRTCRRRCARSLSSTASTWQGRRVERRAALAPARWRGRIQTHPALAILPRRNIRRSRISSSCHPLVVAVTRASTAAGAESSCHLSPRRHRSRGAAVAVAAGARRRRI